MGTRGGWVGGREGGMEGREGRGGITLTHTPCVAISSNQISSLNSNGVICMHGLKQ